MTPLEALDELEVAFLESPPGARFRNAYRIVVTHLRERGDKATRESMLRALKEGADLDEEAFKRGIRRVRAFLQEN